MNICDGCNVNEPFEHKCHGEDAHVQGEPTGKPCECPSCGEIKNEEERVQAYILERERAVRQNSPFGAEVVIVADDWEEAATIVEKRYKLRRMRRYPLFTGRTAHRWRLISLPLIVQKQKAK
ncbi:hypothetical protein ACFL06_01385 [Patescibacteria group bacterium]